MVIYKRKNAAGQLWITAEKFSGDLTQKGICALCEVVDAPHTHPMKGGVVAVENGDLIVMDPDGKHFTPFSEAELSKDYTLYKPK